MLNMMMILAASEWQMHCINKKFSYSPEHDHDVESYNIEDNDDRQYWKWENSSSADGKRSDAW